MQTIDLTDAEVEVLAAFLQDRCRAAKHPLRRHNDITDPEDLQVLAVVSLKVLLVQSDALAASRPAPASSSGSDLVPAGRHNRGWH